MLSAALQKLTLVDYPCQLAAAIFLPGCNFRCPFCHNPQLVNGLSEDLLPWEEILEFLKSRRKYLDGVVLTGGEPLLQLRILEMIREIKALGFKIKLDTNGSNFEGLKSALEQDLVDYVAMDIKAPLEAENYCLAAGLENPNLFETIKKSAEYLLHQSEGKNWDYEFRTTVVPGILELEDLEIIAEQLTGARRYFIQQFNNTYPMLDPKMADIAPYSARELLVAVQKISSHFGECRVRNI